MKKNILVAAACFGLFTAQAQLKIDNAVFYIGTGATVTVQGDVTSNVDIQGAGLLQLKGSALQNVSMGGFTIPNLELDNSANATLAGSHARIGTSMLFTNGKFLLGNQNLLVAPTAVISGNNASRFVVTGGTGVLTKQGLTTTLFNFPVGFSSTEYNPIDITNTGTTDDISVRCMQNVLSNGLTGSPVTSHFADNSWVITEAVAGGSNLVLNSQWASTDELSGFNREKSGIARYSSGTNWDLPAGTVTAAAGSGPYTRNRSAIDQPGVFAVADQDKVNSARLNLKILLQGPYNSGTGFMGDGLRSNGLIPLTQPYSAAISSFFNRAGSIYDGSASVNETVPSATVFDVAGTNDDIVDWVFLSLQNGTTPATRLQTRAALVQRDGDIVEYDATSGTYIPVRMPLDADGNYHLVIGHRNHLPIRTATAQLLQNNTVFSYDFTTAQAQAYQDGTITTNAAMAQSGSAFLMWAGNANADSYVRVTSSTIPPIPSDAAYMLTLLGGNPNATGTTYSAGDINMDGKTRVTTSTIPPIPSDVAFILSTPLGGNSNATRRAHQ